MKLLRVKSNNFKNCSNGFEINMVAMSKKSDEDKEYELIEVADELYVFNTLAFIGKNASGKTSATDLLDVAYSLLGDFRLNKTYGFNDTHILIDFYHDGYIYRYETDVNDGKTINGNAKLSNQMIKRKKYYKSKVKEIFSDEDFKDIEISGVLPEDTSILFFVLKNSETRAIYFDSFEKGADTYRLTFLAIKEYKIGESVLEKIIQIFDENIKSLKMLDEHNFEIAYSNKTEYLSDKQLIYKLSSGTTKGILLYILMSCSLENGFDLIVDEIENHFHKTLVENMISLYKDKTINKKGATLIFTTHYLELLDLFNRQDNIYIARADDKVKLFNMYKDFDVRFELLKSKQFYNNTFKTAVDYDSLMNLKRELKR